MSQVKKNKRTNLSHKDAIRGILKRMLKGQKIKDNSRKTKYGASQGNFASTKPSLADLLNSGSKPFKPEKNLWGRRFKEKKKFLLKNELIVKINIKQKKPEYYTITPYGILTWMIFEREKIMSGRKHVKQWDFYTNRISRNVLSILESFCKIDKIDNKDLFDETKLEFTELYSKLMPDTKENIENNRRLFTPENHDADKAMKLFCRTRDSYYGLAMEHVLNKFDFSNDNKSIIMYTQYNKNLKLNIAELRSQDGTRQLITPTKDRGTKSSKLSHDDYHMYFAYYILVLFIFTLGDTVIMQNSRIHQKTPYQTPLLLEMTIHFYRYLLKRLGSISIELNEDLAKCLQIKKQKLTNR